MKKLLFLCALVGFLQLAAGVPVFLVTGKSPSRLEKIAAEELQFFYQKIYGRKLTVIPESQAKGKSVIYLGNTSFAKTTGVDSSKADREEWILRTAGTNLIISGGVPAGTLYGIYEVLERLGVAFIAPDETVIPTDKPDFPVFNEKRKPAFEGRLIYDAIHNHLLRVKASKAEKERYVKWILRNRINGCATRSLPPLYVGGMYNIPHYPYHNLCDYVPRSLFEKHPEYFQMDEMGRRVKPKSDRMSGSLCMTNADVRRITLESLRKKIQSDRKKYPKEDWPYVYDISTLDNTGYICRCPECKKLISSDGSETELLLDYINFVAKNIRKEYPEIIIRTFGSKQPPRKILPEKNVLIQIDDDFSRRSPFYPTESTLNSWYKKYYSSWKKSAKLLMMWDYWNLGGRSYFNPPRMETVFDTIKPDFKFFLKNKVRAMFIEASLDGNSPQNFMLLNYFAASRLMVNPDADAEKLADTFFKGYFGPAAKMMKNYFDIIRAGIKKQKQVNSTSCGAGHWNYLTPEFMLKFYLDVHKAEKSLPEKSRYAARLRYELITPVWYVLANWQSYEKVFTAAGISRNALLKECRSLSREYTRRLGGSSFKRTDDEFETRFQPVSLNLPRPEKFKDVPAQNFKMISYINFKGVSMFGAKVVKDPESFYGMALKSADPRPERHGIYKLINKKHNFYTTNFVLSNHRSTGRVALPLRQVPQDEKYHWFRIPGSIELKAVSDFWAHGWAIQAPTNHWFTLTNGDPLDNTYDQVWFSAKFTGPAYVKGSRKENAIWVDMAVVTRGEKDNEFVPSASYRQLGGKNRKGNLYAGWSKVNYYKKSGKAEMIVKDGKNAVRLTGSKGDPTVIEGPIIPCGTHDVVRIKVRTIGSKCRVGLYYYKKQGYSCSKFVPAPDTGRQNEYIFITEDMKKSGEIARCSLAVYLPAGTGVCEVDQIEVSVAKKLNVFTKK